MARPQLVGATAAATLPAALSAAVLISAPFAGTTTAPLADSSNVATNVATQQSTQHPQHATQQRTQQRTQHGTQLEAQLSQRSGQPAAGQPGSDVRFSFSVSPGSVATWAASEALLVGLAGGVIVWVRRRRFADD